MSALFLRKARILTLDPTLPLAEAVLVAEGRTISAGSEKDLMRAARAARAEDLELADRAVVPAFIDAHMHLLAYAARLMSVDCGPAAVASIKELKASVRRRAAAVGPGAWVRAAGYDELALAERRHPTRRDLDEAAPDNPVRLLHRSGHAQVLNSRALALAGITGATPEPPGGAMERDIETGEPTGLLIEMNDTVDRALPPLVESDLRAAVREADARLIGYGVTFVQDASPGNGRAEWDLFERMMGDGDLHVGVSMMEGFEHMCELPSEALEGRLRRGPVKIMPRELEHEFWPGPRELGEMLRAVEGAGRTAAVHAVTRRGIETVLQALEAPGRTRGHRVEHCGVCSNAQALRLAAAGAAVVTQPGFIYANGDLLAERLPPPDEADLYPLRRLLEAGVALSGSSDAPVTDPDPIAGLRGAVERRTRSGRALSPDQGITTEEALRLFTTSAARALGLEQERGAIRPSFAADLAVLNQDPTSPEVDWDSLRVEMTILGGEILAGRA